MIGALNPIDHPEAWDVVNLAGIDTPIAREWKGWKRPNKWDVKEGKGAAGATETFVGKPPARGTFTFLAWEAAHFAAWDQLLPMLAYDPTKKEKQAIRIFHPALKDIGVTEVVVDDDGVSAWEHDGTGLWSRTVAFLEYFPTPRKPAISTPSGASTSPGAAGAAKGGAAAPGTQPDPAVTKLQQEADALTKEAQKAYGG